MVVNLSKENCLKKGWEEDNSYSGWFYWVVIEIYMFKLCCVEERCSFSLI